jgi:hypothetical protein
MSGCSVFDATLLEPARGGSGGPPDMRPHDAGRDTEPTAPLPELRDADMMTLDASDGAMAFDARGAGDGADSEVPDSGGDGDGDAALDPDASTCELASTIDYCTEMPALDTAPVIDGVLDCGPPLLPMPENAWNGASALPAAHEAQLALAARPDGLYVYIEVRGQAPAPHPAADEIYCGDAIELYVDADGMIGTDGAYDDPGTMQFIVAAPASAEAPNVHAARYRGGAALGPWSSTHYALTWFADGYALEALIVAADLNLTSWTPATSLGLDVVVDVAGPPESPDLRCGVQLGQYFLRVSSITPSSCGGEPWCDARAFCFPML